jgi:dihydroorotate dehydrogenase
MQFMSRAVLLESTSFSRECLECIHAGERIPIRARASQHSSCDNAGLSMYELIRNALFKFEPERAHALALTFLDAAHRVRLLSRASDADVHAVSHMRLRFANRIGLAAGFDKNGRYLNALGALGFGFIEVGTVTPRPQSGQATPRLFRVPDAQALVNRMGFPNEGADAVAVRLSRHAFRGIVGISIGKNATTPLAAAVDDYVQCYRTVARHADYVAINVSSPNTKDLRQLQHTEHLQPILEALLQEGRGLESRLGRRIPLLTKVSPDASDDDLIAIARLCVSLGVDGVIATNTTVARPATIESHRDEVGGLSGRPLHPLSVRAIKVLNAAARGQLTIMGVGGVMSRADAAMTLDAGADLLQIYTGLVYRGPTLIKELVSMN